VDAGRTRDQKTQRNSCSVLTKVTLEKSVTFVIPQMLFAATVFIAMAWLPIPITSRVVKVMGKRCVPLRLHCEGDVRQVFAVAWAALF
jgi:hypothetical protein